MVDFTFSPSAPQIYVDAYSLLMDRSPTFREFAAGSGSVVISGDPIYSRQLASPAWNQSVIEQSGVVVTQVGSHINIVPNSGVLINGRVATVTELLAHEVSHAYYGVTIANGLTSAGSLVNPDLSEEIDVIILTNRVLGEVGLGIGIRNDTELSGPHEAGSAVEYVDFYLGRCSPGDILGEREANRQSYNGHFLDPNGPIPLYETYSGEIRALTGLYDDGSLNQFGEPFQDEFVGSTNAGDVSSIQPGQTQTIQTPSGSHTVPIMQTVDTPSGEQQVWVGSSYLGGGTSGNNSAANGTTTGQTSGGHQSGPGNGFLSGNSNSNNNNNDDDDDNNGNDNIFGGTEGNYAATAVGAGTAGGVTTTTGTTYVNTGNNPGNNNAAGYNSTVTTGTTYVNTGNNPGNNNAAGYNATGTTADDPRRPILLDLDGNGVQFTDLTRSTVFMEGDEGLKHRTAWAGAGDGVLFYDTDGDNAISDVREYVFTEWDPTAKDDLAALRSRFDTNGDGKLTLDELNGFKVMKTNPDGSLTAVTLASLGITQINLTEDATQITLPDGSQITGQATFVMGGQTRTLANTTLATEADGTGWRGRRPSPAACGPLCAPKWLSLKMERQDAQ